METDLFFKQFVYDSEYIFSILDRMNGTAHSVIYSEHSHCTISSQFNVRKSTCTLIINIPFKLWAKFIHLLQMLCTYLYDIFSSVFEDQLFHYNIKFSTHSHDFTSFPSQTAVFTESAKYKTTASVLVV